MKTIKNYFSSLFLTFFISSVIYAQQPIIYKYDATGNRIERTADIITVAVSATANPICVNQATQLDATTTNGIDPLTYQWNDASLSGSSPTTSILTTTTTYTVTVTDNVGVKGIGSIVVTVNPLPTVNAGTNQSICQGSLANLSATGANQYAWSTGDNTANITVSPTVATSYTVTGTDNNNCSATDMVVVNVRDYYSAEITPANPSICLGVPVRLNALGAPYFSWSSGDDNTPYTEVSPTITTTYTVTGAGPYLCAATNSIVVTVNPLPTVNAGTNQSICLSSTTNLSATGADQYAWSTGETNVNIIVSPTITTTYTLTGTDNNNCSATDAVVVSMKGYYSAELSPENPSICLGESVTLSALGAPHFFWSTGDDDTPSTEVSPTITTTYTVMGAGPYLCAATNSIVVTVNPLPTVNAGTNQEICIGSSTSLSATGADQYAWSTGDNTSNITISPTLTTTYTVTGTDNNNCSTTDAVVVTVRTYYAAEIIPENPSVCIGESVTLSALGATPHFSWSTGDENTPYTEVSPTITTTYIVTGSGPYKCPTTSSIVVTVNPLPTANINIPDGYSQYPCFGASVVLNASGGDTYSWSSGSQTQAITVTPSISTNYNVTVISAEGCTASENIQIDPVNFTVDAGSDQSICLGDNATLSSSTGDGGIWNYYWNGDLIGQTVIVSPTITTTYTLTVMIFGCTNTDEVVVAVQQSPTIANAGIDQTGASMCGLTSTTLAGNTPSMGTGIWSIIYGSGGSLGDSTSATSSFTGTAGTAYILRWTISNSPCANSSSDVHVSFYQNPDANAGVNQSICQSTSTFLTASGGDSYQWSTNNNSSAITVAPTQTTTYSVIASNINGCTASDDVVVTVNPLPTANVGSDVSICIGQSAILSATGGNTYQWSTNDNTSSIIVMPNQTTTYDVVVGNSNGCTASDNVVVTVNPLPTVTTTGGIICSGSSIIISTTGAISYVWSNNGTAATQNVSPTITTVYTVTGTNASGCNNTASATVTVNPLPTITATGGTICLGSSITISAAGANTYSWSNNGTSATQIVNPTITTVYTVTGTNASGCNNSASTTVTVNPLPTVTATGGTICIGSSITITAAGATSYLWSNNGTTQFQSVSPTTTTVYNVTGTNGNGCVNTATTTVTVNPLPTVTATGSVICLGSSITISAAGATSYAWSNNGTAASQSVSPTITTTYSVTGTDGNGCKNNASATVTVNPLPSVTASGGTICKGSSITISAVGASSYAWSNNGTTASQSVSPTITTTYSVTGTDGNGCKNNASATVTVNPLPTASAGANQSICPGSSTSLTATGGGTYLWSTGATTAIISVTPSLTTTYRVTVTNALSCISSPSVTVTIPKNTITSSQSGNWSSGTTWVGGNVPGTCDNVVIAANHSVTIDNTAVCYGLTINSNGTLSGSSNTLNIGGPFTNNGSFIAMSGTVNFAGISTLSGSATTSFNNVVITGIFTGKASANFNVVGNWTNNGTFIHNSGTVTFNEIIPAGSTGGSYYYGSATTNFYNLTINAGCGLTISSGATMNVASYLRLYATGSSAIAQLALQDNTAAINTPGSVQIQSYIVDANWHILASPYNYMSDVPTFTGYYLTKFDEPTDSYIYLTTGATLTPGRGYMTKAGSTITPPVAVTFTKASTSYLNNGSISYSPLTYTSAVAGQGFNMVGNPYPCTIDWQAANGWNCTNITPTIQFYNGSTFATFNSNNSLSTNGGTRYIPPMQGVYVQVDSGAVNAQWGMDNRVRIAYNQGLWKKGDENNLSTDQLNLTISGNGFTDETIIGFAADATNGFDNAYDAYKMFSPMQDVPQINTKSLSKDSSQMAVNFLPVSNISKTTVPLQVTVGVPDTYIITAGNIMSFDSSLTITLQDLEAKTLTNLRSSSYSFSSNAVQNDSRFLVHFGPIPTSVKDQNSVNNINIYSVHGQVVIQNNSSSTGANGFIMIYDMLGKLIVNKSMEPNSVTRIDMIEHNDAQAIYFVKVFTNNQTFTKKIRVTR